MKINFTSFFESYFAACYPKGCSEGQKAEIKQAFFSGAYAMFESTLSISSFQSEAMAEKALKELEREVNDVISSRIANLKKHN